MDENRSALSVVVVVVLEGGTEGQLLKLPFDFQSVGNDYH